MGLLRRLWRWLIGAARDADGMTLTVTGALGKGEDAMITATIRYGRTATITVQPTVGGVPTGSAESPRFLENGSEFLTLVPGSAVAPFTCEVTPNEGSIGQNPIVRCQFDGRVGDGVVVVEELVQFTVVPPDCDGASVTVTGGL